MVSCAATSRVGMRPLSRRELASPNTPFRAASNNAPPSAEPTDPPPAITATALNCDAPVNTSSDIAHVWNTVAPADTAATPNEIAKTPTAKPNVMQADITGRSLGSRSVDIISDILGKSRYRRAEPQHRQRGKVDHDRRRLSLPRDVGGGVQRVVVQGVVAAIRAAAVTRCVGVDQH